MLSTRRTWRALTTPHNCFDVWFLGDSFRLIKLLIAYKFPVSSYHSKPCAKQLNHKTKLFFISQLREWEIRLFTSSSWENVNQILGRKHYWIQHTSIGFYRFPTEWSMSSSSSLLSPLLYHHGNICTTEDRGERRMMGNYPWSMRDHTSKHNCQVSITEYHCISIELEPCSVIWLSKLWLRAEHTMAFPSSSFSLNMWMSNKHSSFPLCPSTSL